MTDHSKSIQASKPWGVYFIVALGVILLLFFIFRNQDTPTNSQGVSDHAPETIQIMAGNQNAGAVGASGVSTSSVSAPTDPFKAFLESHGNPPPPPGTAAPQSPQAIQDIFKEAVRKQQEASPANPFAAGQDKAGNGK